jgi:excisionase family DNA binding protein
MLTGGTTVGTTTEAFDRTFLTKHQVCERLGISRPTLDRRIRAGEIPALYPFGKGRGRIVLFDAREIKRLKHGACSS